MINGKHKSRFAKQFAIGLGVALAVSTIAVPVSGAKQAPKAAAKNDLTIMIGEPNGGWCNQDSPGGDQIAAKNSVFETLTILNKDNKIVPYLAKSVVGSNESKTWTITLREGIMFHDGEELTAATVQMNLMANLGIIRPFTGKGQAGSLPAIAWQEIMPTMSPAQWASNVKIISKYVLQVNLAVKRPNFPYTLWNVGRPTIASTKTLQDPNCGNTMGAGTGPFMISSKGVDQFTTVLKANPKYWRSTPANKLPKASTVTFKVVGDAAQRVNALRKGQADIARFGATSGQQLNLLKTLKSKITLFEGPRETTWSFHLNATRLPFANKDAREAFAYAFDTNSYTKLMTKGNGSPAYQLAVKEHPYYQTRGALKFNLAKAKASVAKYTAATGKSLDVVVPINTTTESLKGAQAICKMLKAAGMNCSISPPVTSQQYILRGFGLQQQMSFFNVVAGRSADFANLFSTNTNLELSGFRFVNPGLAKCFADAAEVDTRKAYAKCVLELQSQSYWIPGYVEGGFLAWTNTTKGIGTTPLPGGGVRPIISGSGFDIASVTKG
jgi:ABC-type transport system substrate-binding protein